MRSVQSKLHLHDLGTQFCDLFVPASGATKSCQHFLFVRLAPQYRLRDARETAACLIHWSPMDYRSFTRFHRRSPLSAPFPGFRALGFLGLSCRGLPIASSPVVPIDQSES